MAGFRVAPLLVEGIFSLALLSFVAKVFCIVLLQALVVQFQNKSEKTKHLKEK